ncbi:hypothetical protein Taro_002120 [Colocasia esculenta]|uniref:Uncharacterized protein n=1 Tax=Colocasia esculenta TaxID=4460 RepID=A0A843TJZ0_COLES|nr:hypothetical protein [Colocasia esculenta]
MILRSARARSCSNGGTMSAKGFIGCPNWLVRLAPGCSFGSSSNKGVRRPSSGARLSSWPPLDGAGRSAGLATFWQGSSLMISSCSSSSSSDGSKTKELTRTSTSGMGWGSSPRKMMVLLRSGKLGFSPSDGASFFPRPRPFPLPRLRRRYVATMRRGKRALAAWLLRIGTAQSRFAGHRGFLTGRGEVERVGPGESGRSEADPVDSLADGGSRRITLTGRRRFAPMRANRADSLRRAKPWLPQGARRPATASLQAMHLVEPAFEPCFALYFFPRDVSVQRDSPGGLRGDIFLQFINEFCSFWSGVISAGAAMAAACSARSFRRLFMFLCLFFSCFSARAISSGVSSFAGLGAQEASSRAGQLCDPPLFGNASEGRILEATGYVPELLVQARASNVGCGPYRRYEPSLFISFGGFEVLEAHIVAFLKFPLDCFPGSHQDHGIAFWVDSPFLDKGFDSISDIRAPIRRVQQHGVISTVHGVI